jgi:hypothetical protein
LKNAAALDLLVGILDRLKLQPRNAGPFIVTEREVNRSHLCDRYYRGLVRERDAGS